MKIGKWKQKAVKVQVIKAQEIVQYKSNGTQKKSFFFKYFFVIFFI